MQISSTSAEQMKSWFGKKWRYHHFAMVQLLRLGLKSPVLANARPMSSHDFYALCLGSSPGLLLSPAPTITIEDDFESCPTFPPSNASCSFPGESGQEIKFRHMPYIYVATEQILTCQGSRKELLFSFILQLYGTQEKKKETPRQKSIFPAKP